MLFDRLLHPNPFFLIAGPCVIEDESLMQETASFLKSETDKRGITLIFKASYFKANRTAVTSYSGPGLEEGLRILQRIRDDFELPVLTDVHETQEVAAIAEVADILQIPAFLSRQTFLIQAAARTGRAVNIKKGQFMAPEDMAGAVEKVTAENNYQILITERGVSFGYHNLVVDFRSFPILRELRYPVVYDVTHSLQRPSVGRTSGGSPEYAGMMARAAIATGMVDGLFVETHPAPMEALSDAASMLPLAEMPDFLDECLRHWDPR
jgi:2-dehydro-3-deoxyphosphooctonate aldolase (KDO 8-P synthase)